MRIHREGVGILATSFVLISIVIISFIYFSNAPIWINAIFVILLLGLFCFKVWFFRNPIRKTISEPLQIIAPVDGKVVVVKKVFVKEFLNAECWQVSIFMSPLNVHVCRYPVSGEVIYKKYHPGKYLVAFHPKSSELNERTTVAVEAANKDKVLFRQIAGAVARRIVLYANEKDRAKAGAEYGFIKFGSRLDVFLPLSAKIHTKLGDTPVGGIDVIAEL